MTKYCLLTTHWNITKTGNVRRLKYTITTKIRTTIKIIFIKIQAHSDHNQKHKRHEIIKQEEMSKKVLNTRPQFSKALLIKIKSIKPCLLATTTALASLPVGTF